MHIFYAIYARSIQWAKHPHAYWYLAIVSFCESTFFPVPVEIILIPMSLAHPQQTRMLAVMTIFISVLGGIFSYNIGWLAIDALKPLLTYTGDWQHYLRAEEWLVAWDVGAIFLAAVSFIPYRIFAIVAGTMNINLLSFVIASILGRSCRFFLIASLLTVGKSFIEYALNKYTEYIGWSLILLIAAFGFYYA